MFVIGSHGRVLPGAIVSAVAVSLSTPVRSPARVPLNVTSTTRRCRINRNTGERETLEILPVSSLFPDGRFPDPEREKTEVSDD
jgi:hypothetical protein